MDSDNVVYRTFNFVEAMMIRSLLEASGIEVHTFDENVARLNPFYSHVVGGIRLLVPAEQIEEAREILQARENGLFEGAGDDERETRAGER